MSRSAPAVTAAGLCQPPSASRETGRSRARGFGVRLSLAFSARWSPVVSPTWVSDLFPVQGESVVAGPSLLAAAC